MLAGTAFTVANNRQRPISPLARRNSSRRKTPECSVWSHTRAYTCLYWTSCPLLHLSHHVTLSVTWKMEARGRKGERLAIPYAPFLLGTVRKRYPHFKGWSLEAAYQHFRLKEQKLELGRHQRLAEGGPSLQTPWLHQARRSVYEHKLPSVQREWLPTGFPVIRTTACD